LGDAVSRIGLGRKAVLFLGAGFSNAAKNLAGSSTPASKQLSARILDKLEIVGEAPLGLAIDKIREKLSPGDAFKFIQEQLTVVSITEVQKYILSLPWYRIFTTNLDTIGSEFSGRKWKDSTEQFTPLSVGDFVYLHGALSGCNSLNWYSKLKLGEQMYMMQAQATSGYHHMLSKIYTSLKSFS